MEILTYPASEVPAPLHIQRLSFYDQDRAVIVHDPKLRPTSMFFLIDSKVLAALDILSKIIVHNGERFAASGLSRVIVDPNERRKGYGTRLVAAAGDLISASGADLGIFTCDHPLQRFYERCGWQILLGAVVMGGTVRRPLFSDELKKVTLARFFTSKARLHAHAFQRCHIALYPGDIDRLW